MVCGLCKKKQTVKNSCDCGMSLKRSSGHWEGGRGTRDKAAMSKKDKKKYSK